MTRDEYDVVVVGGGPAGLGGALQLARSRRSVLVVDSGHPRNATSPHLHSYLTRDGTPPAEFRATARAEATGYGAEIVTDTVVALAPAGDRFTVRVAGGGTVLARRLLVTTGIVDELPDVAGLADRWGRDVLHCPYCHGWEVRDQPVGILATGPHSLHSAQLFRQLTDQVTLLRHSGPDLTAEQAEALAARDITVVDGPVEACVVTDEALSGVRLRSGAVVGLRALVVAPRPVVNAELFRPLGIELVEHPSGLGGHVPADPTGRTAVPGVWVAGNVTDLWGQVLTAAAGGSTAGAMVNADLVAEEVRLAVAGRRPATL